MRCSNMIFHGVLERYPKLKLFRWKTKWAGCRSGWASRQRLQAPSPCGKSPDEQIAERIFPRQIYATFFNDMVGGSCFLVGQSTTACGPTTTRTRTRPGRILATVIARDMAHLAAAIARKLLNTNVRKLYQLEDPVSLRPRCRLNGEPWRPRVKKIIIYAIQRRRLWNYVKRSKFSIPTPMRGISTTTSDTICRSPIEVRRASFIPSEHYDRNLGGTLGQSGAKVEDRLAAMDTQQIHTAVMFPTSGLGVGRVRDPQFQIALCRAYNDFISDYCKASPRLKSSGKFAGKQSGGMRQRAQPGGHQTGVCAAACWSPRHTEKISAARNIIRSTKRRSGSTRRYRCMLSAVTSPGARFSIRLFACIRQAILSRCCAN